MEKTRGFTLVELMVSMLVMGLGLLAMLLAHSYVLQTGEAAYERMVAHQDANRTLELIRNASAAGTFPQNVTNAFPQGRNVPGFTNLNNEQVVVNYADPTADPLDITVTTTWRERGTRPYSIQLRNLMTQREAP